MGQFSIAIDRVVDLLGLERSPKSSREAESFRVKCPFCHDVKYHMSISRRKNAYNCFLCSTGGGALDLYGRVALGTPLVKGKRDRGGNGHILFAKLSTALGIPRLNTYERTQTKPESKGKESPMRAKDEILDKVYSALLSLKPLSLSDLHTQNLYRRGLDDHVIAENGYRTLDESCEWISQYPNLVKEYFTLGIEAEAMTFVRLKWQTQKQRIAGYIIARLLEREGVTSFLGVPGFYRLKGKWLFRVEPGMLIPSRNQLGQIVCLQSRKESGNLRYMTVSSKSLPYGVTEGISRLHFPLGNGPLDKDAKVMIIEGPLKADVAAFLMGEKANYIVAIQGVNITRDLPAFFAEAKKAGATEILNYFDMDKLTNPNVAKASRSLYSLAKEQGLDFRMQAWDLDYARVKWMELTAICRAHGLLVACSEPEDLFQSVTELANILHENNVEHSNYLTPSGVKKHYWRERTKGIDDFLLSLRSDR